LANPYWNAGLASAGLLGSRLNAIGAKIERVELQSQPDVFVERVPKAGFDDVNAHLCSTS
jgi:hypothetical protein